MKGLILSGGKGTRLWPYTHAAAKQLIPIANRPILFYAIDALVAAGVTDIGIVVGDCGAEIRRAVGDGGSFGVPITYIDQAEPRGLAHAVQVARPFVGSDDFVLYLGDNLLPGGIARIVDQFSAEQPDALIVLAHVAEPLCFGIAEFEDERLVRLVEKPVATTSDLALVGVYMFNAGVFDAIAGIGYSARGELEITDAIQRMIDDGRAVAAHVLSEPGSGRATWKDAGSLEGLLEANRIVLDGVSARVDARIDRSVRVEGSVVVECGALLHDCVVRGPAIIGDGSIVANACVGPYTSIGDGCVVRCAQVEHSIVLEGSRLEDIAGRVVSSLIGRRCTVTGVSGTPRSHGLLLRDGSEVELA
jgi:glucose-1-phosphate thymidylyltransferase